MTRSYRNALMVSVALHIAVGFLMLNSFSWQKPKQITMGKLQPTVKAEAVDLSMVENEIKRVERQQAREQQQEQARIKQAKAEAQKAKQARIKEQQRVNALKKQQQDLQKQHEGLKQQQLAKAKENEATKRELEQLKKNQQAARQRLADLTEQQKKAAEAVKRAQEQAKREAELAEKKRQAELAEREQVQLAKARREKLRNVTELDRYQAMIREAIRTFWRVPDGLDPNLVCQLMVRLAPGGDVLEVSLLKSSGDAVLDRSARTAVLKASPLPVPENSVLFDHFREFKLTVRPSGVDAYM